MYWSLMSPTGIFSVKLVFSSTEDGGMVGAVVRSLPFNHRISVLSSDSAKY